MRGTERRTFLLEKVFVLNVTRLQLLLDCCELESRLTETLALVTTADYGKDQLATRSLLTKHQVEHTL